MMSMTRARNLMMPDEMPLDPFHSAPNEMITTMKGLSQLHAAAIMSGLPERTATQFIADVFVGFSVLNAQNVQASDNPEETG